MCTLFIDTLYGGWFAFTKEFQTAINNKSTNILPVTYEELKIVSYILLHRIVY